MHKHAHTLYFRGKSMSERCVFRLRNAENAYTFRVVYVFLLERKITRLLKMNKRLLGKRFNLNKLSASLLYLSAFGRGVKKNTPHTESTPKCIKTYTSYKTQRCVHKGVKSAAEVCRLQLK